MATITLAAPMCSPARYWQKRVSDNLAYYPTWRGQFKPEISAREVKSGPGPYDGHIEITVRPSEKSAKWAEYVLLRYGYERVGKYLDPRNAGWARRYLGLDAPGGWHESTCKNTPKNARVADLAPLEGGVVTPNPPPRWEDKQQTRGPRGLLDILKDLL
jgi:hypothetical protein